jgi:UDP-glucose 4-epimerase
VVAIFSDIMLAEGKAVLYGFGKMVRDYVYVSDAVAANLAALDKGSGETLNVGTGKPTSVRELFDTMAEIFSYSVEPEMKPARDGELETNFLSCDRARRVLEWEPLVDLKEGLLRTTEWHRRRSS